jgi:hypothetical protein
METMRSSEGRQTARFAAMLPRRGQRGERYDRLRGTKGAVMGGMVLRLVVIAALVLPGVARAADHIDIGVVPAMGRAPEFIAMDKGYFKELGLDVNLAPIDSTARAAAANADGSLPILGGGISVGFFNSLASGFHIKLMLEGGSTPIGASAC